MVVFFLMLRVSSPEILFTHFLGRGPGTKAELKVHITYASSINVIFQWARPLEAGGVATVICGWRWPLDGPFSLSCGG